MAVPFCNIIYCSCVHFRSDKDLGVGCNTVSLVDGADVSETVAVCMKTAGFFKILLCIYKTSCRDIPENSSLDIHCHERLRILKVCF